MAFMVFGERMFMGAWFLIAIDECVWWEVVIFCGFCWRFWNMYVINNLGLLSICYVFGCGVDLCLGHLGFVNSFGLRKWNGSRNDA